MKILILHNRYAIRGGEDTVVSNELEALNEINGVEAKCLSVDNNDIDNVSKKIFLFFGALFSVSSFLKTIKEIDNYKPDIIHVHNYFPQFSPSVFYAAKFKRCPIVHTLHNYRAICPTAFMMYNNNIITDSITKSPWWALKHKVYRGSFLGTFSLVAMIVLHKRIGTWKNQVDQFICLTNFSKDIYTKAGWPSHKLCIKPNFTVRHSVKKLAPPLSYAIYVGRISDEKGIRYIIDAWTDIQIPLYVVGDGPLLEEIKSYAPPHVKFFGRVSQVKARALIARARFLIMASTWYEGFPMVIVESFSVGTPAVVPRIGGLSEVVDDGLTGVHFESKSRNSLIKAVEKLGDDKFRNFLASNALIKFEDSYQKDINIKSLLSIYEAVIERYNDK